MSDNNNVNANANANEINLEERINANFGATANTEANNNSERLREVNKKLPDWNLEPPMNFIK